jgi:DNA-binding MarR family transcriptional regulator
LWVRKFPAPLLKRRETRLGTLTTVPSDTGPDEVDQVVCYWHRANPDLDITTKALAMRIRRVAHLLERVMHAELGRDDAEAWEVEMLLALRRAPEGRSTAGGLQRAAQVTSGAITNRLGRLEQRGWVRRDVDLSDRRQVLVTLTAAGQARVDELIAAKSVAERRFFAALDRDALVRINADLKALMAANSRVAAGPTAPIDDESAELRGLGRDGADIGQR